MSRVFGALAAFLALCVAGVVVLATNGCDTQPDLDVPEEGDDLLAWAAANPDATRCPNSPAEEGL